MAASAGFNSAAAWALTNPGKDSGRRHHFQIRTSGGKGTVEREIVPLNLTGEARQDSEDGIVFGKNFSNGGGGVDAEAMKFAEQQKAERLIHFGAGENQIADGGIAGSVPRPELGRRVDLSAEIGRGVEQSPLAGCGVPGELSLRARRYRKFAFAHTTAIRTCTIPLWKSAARRAA